MDWRLWFWPFHSLCTYQRIIYYGRLFCIPPGIFDRILGIQGPVAVKIERKFVTTREMSKPLEKRRINNFAVSACTRVVWKMLRGWWLCTGHIPQHVYLHMATFILRYLEGSNNHVQGLWGYLGDWWRKHHVRLHMTVGPLKLVLQQLPQKDLVRRNGQWNPSNMKRAG